MSDTTDDIKFHGEQLLNKSKTRPLRKHMSEFASKQEDVDLKTLRETVTEGENLSDIVREDREERV